MLFRWFVAMFFALASCCTYRDTHFTPTVIGYEYATSVRVSVLCLNGAKVGSGVIISKRHVLTAKHVVSCELGSPLLIVATDWKGKRFPMSIDKHSAEHDISRIAAAFGEEPFNIYARVDFKPHEMGETVCAVTGDEIVQLIRKCGEIGPVYEETYMINIHIVPGNSGSALWSDSGEVIGINTRARWTEGDEHIGITEKIENVKQELFSDIYYLD